MGTMKQAAIEVAVSEMIEFHEGRGSVRPVMINREPVEVAFAREIERLRAENDRLAMQLMEKVLDVPIAFGLRAQGHIPTIERMLADGADWDRIGIAIGWCPKTAKEHWERIVAAPTE
jgi:hypothetical protein